MVHSRAAALPRPLELFPEKVTPLLPQSRRVRGQTLPFGEVSLKGPRRRGLIGTAWALTED